MCLGFLSLRNNIPQTEPLKTTPMHELTAVRSSAGPRSSPLQVSQGCSQGVGPVGSCLKTKEASVSRGRGLIHSQDSVRALSRRPLSALRGHSQFLPWKVLCLQSQQQRISFPLSPSSALVLSDLCHQSEDTLLLKRSCEQVSPAQAISQCSGKLNFLHFLRITLISSAKIPFPM